MKRPGDHWVSLSLELVVSPVTDNSTVHPLGVTVPAWVSCVLRKPGAQCNKGFASHASASQLLPL